MSTKMPHRKVCLVVAALIAFSCSEQQFSADQNPSRSGPRNPASGNESPSPSTATPSSDPQILPTEAELPNDGKISGTGGESSATLDQIEAPTDGLVSGTDGLIAAGLDVGKCVNLPSRGLVNYGSSPQCAANSVVMLINDGSSKEMTCCPLAGKQVLSTKPSEINQRRNVRCDADEVATGMVDSAGPVLLCSKVDTRFFKVSPATKVAIYARRNTDSLTAEMRSLVEQYNVNDTCICPENYMVLGNHTLKDNQCEDRCGQIVKK
jgi:hypothetical protein